MRRLGFVTGLCFLFAVLLSLSPQANASTITWNYWGNFSNNPALPDVGGGTLTIAPNGGGAYLITAITGTFDGAAITSILPIGSCCSPPNNDNLLYLTGGALLDLSGLAFSTATASFNLYFGGINGLVQAASTPYADIASPGSGYGIFAVPEPSSVALFAIGLGGLFLLRRRRNV